MTATTPAKDFASVMTMIYGYTMVEIGKKTLTKKPSNDSLSHERGSERSERASERVSAPEGASKASSPEQANK